MFWLKIFNVLCFRGSLIKDVGKLGSTLQNRRWGDTKAERQPPRSSSVFLARQALICLRRDAAAEFMAACVEARAERSSCRCLAPLRRDVSASVGVSQAAIAGGDLLSPGN